MLDEVMPAGTRTRKVKVKAEPKPLKPVLPKRRQPFPPKPVGRPPIKKESEEYEVCTIFTCIGSDWEEYHILMSDSILKGKERKNKCIIVVFIEISMKRK